MTHWGRFCLGHNDEQNEAKRSAVKGVGYYKKENNNNFINNINYMYNSHCKYSRENTKANI